MKHLWRYLGKESGFCGTIHRVLIASDGDITTIGFRDEEPHCGWHGPAGDFHRQFSPMPLEGGRP